MTTTLRRAPAGFAAPAADWWALHRRCRAATPFRKGGHGASGGSSAGARGLVR